MADVPQHAITAALAALPCADDCGTQATPYHEYDCHSALDADEMLVILEAAERAWPHEPPKPAPRDVASTTATTMQVSVPDGGRHRFGFGPAHITSTTHGDTT